MKSWSTHLHRMRTERYKRTSILGRIRAAHWPPEPNGAGRPAPRPSGSVQPPAEGTGGASGAAAPFGEEGVSAGGSGLGGA